MTTMKMINLSPEELQDNDVVFNNQHLPEEESFSVEMSYFDSSWGNQFYLWVNGELVATYKTFRGLMNRALPIIATNRLEKVA